MGPSRPSIEKHLREISWCQTHPLHFRWPNVTVSKPHFFLSSLHCALHPRFPMVTWNYTEASHGTGAPGGVGGALKHLAFLMCHMGPAFLMCHMGPAFLMRTQLCHMGPAFLMQTELCHMGPAFLMQSRCTNSWRTILLWLCTRYQRRTLKQALNWFPQTWK